MSVATTTAAGVPDAARTRAAEKHPKGLYVLFLTEMWERFSFYTVAALWPLYVQNTAQGFGWTQDHATSTWSYYLLFVYGSPLLGGILADRKLGYRRAVTIGGLFFIAGHALLAFRSVPVMFMALACLVIGNGLFKPNVSTMVGNLYPEGSHLKDRAYILFYMGINIGAFVAPLLAEYMSRTYGFHPAFFMGALGMVVSVSILWRFRRLVEPRQGGSGAPAAAAAVTADLPPQAHENPIDRIPDARRVMALVALFPVIVVFWMMLHQNQTTWTYFANDNTAWSVSGVISNAINPGWILLLTFPLIWFWGRLDRRGREPGTPAKMAFGMCLAGCAYFVMALAGRMGGDTGRVSPLWIIGGYGFLTLGELLFSPMGLALVSKVAPRRLRGFMMGGWFLATAVGNKLTAIGVLWDDIPHSHYFALLGGLSLLTALALALLLKPLKKAMPGV
ncbi:MAG TPA: peptide MFS transporter [Thermoanaerobaculia bacterium]|nr:peptide MFS transporter [Thermoanaerobaculia bacterium]